MKKTKFTYPSADKQTNIHAIIWTPESAPIGIVQLTHGMNEFIDRYDDFATFLTSKGYVVVGQDHLGHGQSIIAPEKRGYFAEQNPDMRILQDMLSLMNQAKEQFPKLSYTLFGHSMGSFFARSFLMHYSNEVQSAIICGTMYQPNFVVNFGKKMCEKSAKKNGWAYHDERINALMYGNSNKKFEPSTTHHDWLTRDENVIKKYDSDERTQFTFTLNANYAVLCTLRYINDPKHIQQIPKNLPILFISGTDDPVGNFGKSIPKIVSQWQKQGLKNITSILYPEYRHELLNELDNDKVYDDIAEWLSSSLQ